MKAALLLLIVSMVLPARPGWAARVRHVGDRRVEALNQQQLDKARGGRTAEPAPLRHLTPPILGAPLMELGMPPGVGSK